MVNQQRTRKKASVITKQQERAYQLKLKRSQLSITMFSNFRNTQPMDSSNQKTKPINSTRRWTKLGAMKEILNNIQIEHYSWLHQKLEFQKSHSVTYTKMRTQYLEPAYTFLHVTEPRLSSLRSFDATFLLLWLSMLGILTFLACTFSTP